MGNVIGMQHVLSTVNVVDPSNILSGIAFGKYENFTLFLSVNASFIKLWDNPGSRSVQNGQRGLWVAQDVNDRKKELGEMDVAFKQR